MTVIDSARALAALGRAAGQLAAVEARLEAGGLPMGEYHQLVGQADALRLVLKWGGVWGGDAPPPHAPRGGDAPAPRSSGVVTHHNIIQGGNR